MTLALLCVCYAAVVWSLSHAQLFCNSMDYSLPGLLVHGIIQARILEWVAISFSRESSRPRDRTCVSCIDRRILYHRVTREAQCVLDTHGKLMQFKLWPESTNE